MDTKHEKFCIILGAMKCGTTSLFNALALHPDIRPAREKEPGFFSFPHVYEKGVDWYTNLWEQRTESQSKSCVFLEASTHYTKDPDISSGAHLMSKHLNNVALIYIVRDPIERIESQSNFDLMRGRLLSKADYTNEVFLNTTRYMHQLQPYIDEFGMEKILILNFSDLISRNVETLQRVARFIGVNDSFFSHSKLKHRNKTPNVVTKYNQIIRWASYHGKSRLVKAFLRVFCLPLHLLPVKRERMTLTDKENVLNCLAPDIRAFWDLFGWYPMSEATRKISEQVAALNADKPRE